jgi:hypothetical protein
MCVYCNQNYSDTSGDGKYRNGFISIVFLSLRYVIAVVKSIATYFRGRGEPVLDYPSSRRSKIFKNHK